MTGTYADGPFSAYANLAYERALGRDIETSQFNFGADDLAFIQSQYIFLDHNQTYTGSAGVAYAFAAQRPLDLYGGHKRVGAGRFAFARMFDWLDQTLV